MKEVLYKLYVILYFFLCVFSLVIFIVVRLASFRFGDGYIVVVRVKGSLPNMQPVQSFMEETFPDIILKVGQINVWIQIHPGYY